MTRTAADDRADGESTKKGRSWRAGAIFSYTSNLPGPSPPTHTPPCHRPVMPSSHTQHVAASLACRRASITNASPSRGWLVGVCLPRVMIGRGAVEMTGQCRPAVTSLASLSRAGLRRYGSPASLRVGPPWAPRLSPAVERWTRSGESTRPRTRLTLCERFFLGPDGDADLVSA